MSVGVSARAIDGVYGRPAAGVPAHLQWLDGSSWEPVARVETDTNGKIAAWADWSFRPGTYRIVFDSDHYFAGLGLAAAYSDIAVAFRLRDESDTCIIQVAISPSSYMMHFETSG
jgi:5-hydroxyisourate hydrolase